MLGANIGKRCRVRPAGTGPEVFGNTNAPPAVTSSAVIYALRSMVPADIPLNQARLLPHSRPVELTAWNEACVRVREVSRLRCCASQYCS